jgi:hypothetical protein
LYINLNIRKDENIQCDVFNGVNNSYKSNVYKFIFIQGGGIIPAHSLFLSWLWIWICSGVFLQAEHFHTMISLQLSQVIAGTRMFPQNLHDSLLNMHSHQDVTWDSKPRHMMTKGIICSFFIEWFYHFLLAIYNLLSFAWAYFRQWYFLLAISQISKKLIALIFFNSILAL